MYNGIKLTKESVLRFDHDGTALVFTKSEEEFPMLYHIKPEYCHMWGDDATAGTVLDSEDVEMITRGWGKTPADVIDQLSPVPSDMVDLVAFLIRHHEDYPETGEITPDTAQTIIDNLAFPENAPGISTAELAAIWNLLVHDPKVMTPD